MALEPEPEISLICAVGLALCHSREEDELLEEGYYSDDMNFSCHQCCLNCRNQARVAIAAYRKFEANENIASTEGVAPCLPKS